MKGSQTQTTGLGPESGGFGNGGAVGMCHVLHDAPSDWSGIRTIPGKSGITWAAEKKNVKIDSEEAVVRRVIR